MMDDIRVPIYLVTGFLESGKTTFLDFTLQQEYFAIDGKTLSILCEEGEEEYDMDKLKLTNTVVEVIEDEEDRHHSVWLPWISSISRSVLRSSTTECGL